MEHHETSDFLQLGQFKKSWKQDLRAGVVIFLIALPLSIGIALASGAPATAGLWSAVIGGLLGSLLCGGHVMINGPAAGLIVVVWDAVQALGFQKTLAAIFFAGLMQIAFGLLKAGRLAASVPIHVLHGMLASIGVTIIAKQIYVLCGTSPAVSGTLNQIIQIPKALAGANGVVLFVGLCCLISVVGMSVNSHRLLRLIPAPLVGVALGIAFDKIFDLEHVHTLSFLDRTFEVGDKYLLHVPTSVLSAYIPPDWSALTDPVFWKMSITVALVASIESILSAYAIDRIDPLQRRSDLNFELVSKGVCNAVLGLVGGLPIITEIVRSSANIASGAQTRWSNFVHGALILLFVVAVPGLLNMIPLAAFAAILIVVGFRLAHPQNFTHAKEIGWDQFLLFTFTLVAVLLSDLLVGVFAGLSLKLVFNAYRGKSFRKMFVAEFEARREASRELIAWKGPAVFLNILALNGALERMVSRDLVLDLSQATFIDHTFIDFVEKKKKEFSRAGRHLTVEFSDGHVASSDHPLSSRILKSQGV